MLAHETRFFSMCLNVDCAFEPSQYVTGHGKRAHFAHYFKIDLLVFNGSVDLKQ